MAESTVVPFWWIVVFVILALGVAAGAILFVGGELVGSVGVLLPV